MKRNKRYGHRVNELTKRLLGEAEEAAAQGSYEEFFQSALKKFGVSSPDELEDDKKDEFFNYVDANWDAGENETDIDEADIPDSPDVDDFIDNMEDDPDPESELREMIRNEIRAALTEADEPTIRDKDIAAAGANKILTAYLKHG